jgi:hypothetical protein
MDKSVASKVVDAILALERQLSALDVLSDKITDDQERREFRRRLASMIVAYTDMLISVIEEYPELDPDTPSSTSDNERA